jgi:integrase
MMMALLRLRNVHSFVEKKTGKVYYYFRHRSEQWPLPGVPGSTEFTRAYDAFLQRITTGKRARVIFAATTLGGVIEQYISSKAFNLKAPATKRIYRRILDQLSLLAGRCLMIDLQERHVRKMRQHFRSSSLADKAVMLIGVLWVFAKENLAMQLGPNPVTDIRQLHRRARVYEPWPIDLIEQLRLRAKPTVRLAISLLLYTGQRIGDVTTMRWAQYDGTSIRVRQQKTDALLQIPVHSALKAVLDAAPRRSEFILGVGYSVGGLSQLIKRALERAGAGQYTAHGLRKNAAIALAEAGCTPHEVAAVTGHRSLRMVQHYTAGAEQKKLARSAIDRLEVARTRTEVGGRCGKTR